MPYPELSMALPTTWGSASGISHTTTSEVRKIFATEHEFSSAHLITFVGSMMPLTIKSSKLPVAALYPKSGFLSEVTRSTTTEPLSPALDAMSRMGYLSARLMISAPSFCSSLGSASLISSTAAASLSSVHPPPMTMPSSTAALVALSASSTRSFFSLSSVSVCAPTWMMATPPLRRAARSLSFSFSYSASVPSMRRLICFTRASTSRLVLPSPTIVQLSLPSSMRAALPSTSVPTLSRDKPSSSFTTVAPVRIAMSSRYCDLRSPKPGALSAQIFSAPRSLFTTSVASASCSMSSAMISKGKPCLIASSRMMIMSRADLTFLSTSSSLQLSYEHVMRSESVTK
mmetsp:Transcript_6390/g.27213  ORF Transcript_6390/g.27213 Transcript_6390/m.27213 type:complete len:344 (+) Transcript_6390:197-1228(+)